ncbi:MAG TPA: ATP-binding protein [Burkholderiaceae bacterium]
MLQDALEPRGPGTRAEGLLRDAAPLSAHPSQAPGHAGDSGYDSALNERIPASGAAWSSSRWIGWRLRLLVLLTLLGCVSVFALTNSVVGMRHVDAMWHVNPQGQVELADSSEPALKAHRGHVLVGVSGRDDTRIAPVEALALKRSARWVVDDATREHQRALHAGLAAAFAQPQVRFHFADGVVVSVEPQPHALVGLPPVYWFLIGVALALYMLAVIALLSRPSARNLAYLVMAWCQAGNLVFIAVDSTLELGLPDAFLVLDMPVRMAFDLITTAAMVNAACLHPRRLPGSGWIAIAGWVFALVPVGLLLMQKLPHAWWWVQLITIVLGLTAIALLSWSYNLERHPFALVLRRFGVVMISTWSLLTLALGVAHDLPGMPNNIADVGSMIWYVFLASVLLLIPFLARSQTFMREFSLLAAISTVATSLDLLFVAVFSLGQFTSLTLSLFVSLAIYSGARQWILNQLLGSSMLTTERMFEQLYRIAREVEARPERTPALLTQLLRDLFDPLEANLVDRKTAKTRAATDGSSLLVPVPELDGSLSADAAEEALPAAVMIRFAHRGRRLFTSEDARLTDRIVEQLRRAVHFDRAVEQGRSEERLRLAQDLHDDIGARLLTLMYKAQSPEMEDYVRHTLQDLKTLTRGLAASNHRLSHAAAEWKADLAQRLTAAHVELKWTFTFDEDILLSVVQWSALTRVLRELVSNAIAHAQAQTLEIDFTLANDRIELVISDDGVGHDPRSWSHGLGLGGVRKRVKQLGGQVEWREIMPHGICCRVVIRHISAAHG